MLYERELILNNFALNDENEIVEAQSSHPNDISSWEYSNLWLILFEKLNISETCQPFQ